MNLLPKSLAVKLPGPREQEGRDMDETIVHARYFLPGTGWSWFVTEAWALVEYEPEPDNWQNPDPPELKEVPLGKLDKGQKVEDVIFFGPVRGDVLEWGTFSLGELKTLRGRMGLRVERDLYWEPKRWADVPDDEKGSWHHFA